LRAEFYSGLGARRTEGGGSIKRMEHKEQGLRRKGKAAKQNKTPTSRQKKEREGEVIGGNGGKDETGQERSERVVRYPKPSAAGRCEGKKKPEEREREDRPKTRG